MRVCLTDATGGLIEKRKGGWYCGGGEAIGKLTKRERKMLSS